MLVKLSKYSVKSVSFDVEVKCCRNIMSKHCMSKKWQTDLGRTLRLLWETSNPLGKFEFRTTQNLKSTDSGCISALQESSRSDHVQPVQVK